MIRMLMTFTAIWACLACAPGYAQSGIGLSGKVTDSAGQPIAYARVVLYSLPDSVIATSAVADTVGAFHTDAMLVGMYLLRAEALGYNSYAATVALTTADGPVKALPPISMQAAYRGLSDVVVTGRKALITRKPDRTVVNVDAMLSAAGNTALEVLEKSPGVRVDQSSGSISLNGRQGVTIYIDDKPTYLSGTDLTDYLRSMPASTVNTIELMTNPPAQYDAAGTGGIINIVTKRSKMKGFNGGLNLGLIQGQKTRTNNSVNLNYRDKKTNLFANFGHNLSNNFTDLVLNRAYRDAAGAPTAYFEQKSYFTAHSNTFNLRAGADYYHSDKTTFGILLTGMQSISSRVNDNTSTLLNPQRSIDSFIVAQNKNDIRFTNGGINLNYRTKFTKPGHGLTADADYLTYRDKTEQVYHNSGYLPDGTALAKDMLNGHLPGLIDIYTIKTDYTLPLTAAWKLTAGLKSALTQTNNKADYTTTVGGATNPDYNKSNHFIYNENINAAYASINQEAGKLSVQAGIRVEQTRSDGHQLGNLMKPDSLFSRNYTNLFPTLYLTYKYDSSATHQTGLNYGQRIQRPYFQDLNPFINPMDKFTFYVGNPFLRPSLIQNLELSHTYKNRVTATLMYSKSKDDVNETIEIVNGIYYSKPGNIGSKTMMSLTLDAELDPTKWLNMHIYSEYTNIASKGSFNNGTINTSGNFWYIGGNVRIAFGKGWDGEAYGNYRTKLYDAQFIMGRIWQTGATIQKKLSTKATLRLGVNDIFYSGITTGEIGSLSMATANWINKSDTRYASCTFSYRFGTAAKNDRQHDASSADAERNRVKN